MPVRTMAVKGRGLPRYETAQIAFLEVGGWRLIGRYWDETGLDEYFRLPEVSCPVVDLRGVEQESSARLIRRMTGPAGCANVPALVRGLVRLGATVSYPAGAAQ